MTSDIKLSRKYIELIMNKCIAIDSQSNDYYFYATTVTALSEAILHFMLTICTLPSERKIAARMVYLLMWSYQAYKLWRSNLKSIIVQFIKEKTDLNKVSQLESLEPNCKNIWLISAKPLSLTTKYTTYYVLPNAKPDNKFSNII